MRLSLNEIWKRISNIDVKNILITAHAYPDGDSISSQLGLYYLLKSIGKNVYIYNNDPVPIKYRFLPSADEIKTEYNYNLNPHLIIILDVIPWERLGKVRELSKQNIPLIIMDHHIYDKPVYFDHFIDHQKAATSQIIFDLYKTANIEIEKDAAIALYTGLMTDTGRFRFSNTNSDVFRTAAQLVDAGADPELIARNVYFNKSISYLKNLSKVLNTIELYKDNAILFCYFTMEMNNGKAITMEETEDIIEQINSLKDVKLYIFIKEYRHNEFKISFRSRDNFDARSIATQFNGGGHKHSAGAKIQGPIENVKKKLFEVLNI